MAFAFNKSTPSTGPVAMYELKTLLKAQGWTVPSSSDGTTYNASSDVITSGAAGASGLNNTNAWFIVRDPAGTMELCFQRVNATTVWRIKWSRSAKFSGGTPGATRVPSATDEYLVWGAGTDASPSGSLLFTTDGTYRWYGGADSSAPYGFWFAGWLSSVGTATTAIVLDPLTPSDATDSSKHIFYLSTTGGGGAPFNSTTSGMTSEGQAVGTQMVCGYTPNASAGSAIATTYQAASLYTGGSQAVPLTLGGNPISGADEVFSIHWMRRSAMTNPGYKGAGTLMKWCGTTRATGDTLTVSTSRDRIVVNHTHMPWDGTVPTV
jgi:hypothetical protein